MACTCPIYAYPPPPRDLKPGDKPDRRLVFSSARSYSGAKAITLPCGKCDGCRLSRSRGWATRIVHESQLHESSWFVTLTFAPEHLPSDMSVSVRTHQLFMKRLRERFGPVRFFMRAEYGERFLRPHYHYILFGLALSDLVPWKKGTAGDVLYRSATFETVWPLGQCLLGRVNAKSAAYCAGYVNKKRHGEDDYTRWSEFGFPWQVEREFVQMSRSPGIGAGWFSKFKSDAFPSDFVVLDGERRPVPRFYKSKLSEDEARRLVLPRRLSIDAHAGDNTDDRLRTRHESARIRAERFVRDVGGEG